LLLRHDQRRGLCGGLCMRSGTCELHRCERGRCKQHETKSGHGDLGSWNHFGDKAAGINKQALGRNEARFKCQFRIYFRVLSPQARRCSLRIQA
jgi:hypothetical protein